MDFDALALAHDLKNVSDDDWVPHFGTDIYEGDWSGIALRSVTGRTSELYPDPGSDAVFTDTELLARSPNFAAALDRFSCDLEAARLLRLGPGASIAEHVDFEQGYEDGEVRIHLPITTNSDVEFVVGGTRIDMQPGEAWYANFKLPHSVANRGSTSRVHLLVDCRLNEWLDDVLHKGAGLRS